MSESNEWEDLIDRHLRSELSEAEQERLAELIDSDASLRKDFVQRVQWDVELSQAMRIGERSDELVSLAKPVTVEDRGATQLLRGLLAIAAAAILVLSLLLFAKKTPDAPVAGVDAPTTPASIAKITGVSGALVWTGDRGEVARDITVGSELIGGTIEGLTPDSWCELRFHDGSTVMISGNSMLTFSDAGQSDCDCAKAAFPRMSLRNQAANRCLSKRERRYYTCLEHNSK